jgi:ADP-heptose:LPS heptosyltransferase
MTAPDLSRERILVMVYGHVADTIAALPSLRLLRATYPNAQLEVLCLRSVAPLLNASGYVNHLVIWDDFARKRGRFARVEKAAVVATLAVRLRTRHYGAVLVFHRSFGAFRRLATLLGAPLVAGISAGNDGYTHPAPLPVGGLESSLEENRRVLAAIGIADDPQTTRLSIPDADRAYASDLLSEVDGQRLIGIHPGSDWSCQQWLGNRFVEVARQLATQTGARIVITGASSELRLQDEIAGRLDREPIRCAGRTSLMQLAAVIERLDLLIAVNSAAAAFARALDTPLVVLLGPEDGRLTGLDSSRRVRIMQPGGARWPGSWCEFGRWGLLSGCESPMCRGVSGLDQLDAADVVSAALHMLGETMTEARTA